MQFWLCRENDGMYQGRYTFTNYCPYRAPESDTLKGLYFYYPTWLGGAGFSVEPARLDNNFWPGLESLGGDIPFGSCKNLVTGQIFNYDELISIDSFNQKKYYSWGV